MNCVRPNSTCGRTLYVNVVVLLCTRRSSALGCEERGPLDSLWKNIFGLEASASKRLEKENVEEDIVKLGPKNSVYEVELDLMTPIDADKSPKV